MLFPYECCFHFRSLWLRFCVTGTPFSPLLLTAAQTTGVSALLVKGNFLFDSANHRDFLGACLGTGIERSKVGDILMQGEQGANILVVPDLVPYLEMNLTSVSTHKLLSTLIQTAQLYGTVTFFVRLKSVAASSVRQGSCAKYAYSACNLFVLIIACQMNCQLSTCNRFICCLSVQSKHWRAIRASSQAICQHVTMHNAVKM